MKTTERAHIHYFDYLRIFAAVSVIYMHVAANPLRAGVNSSWHVMNTFVSLGFTAVPLFFMMSGALLLSGEKTLDIRNLLSKRLPRLAIPLAFWSVVALLWTAYLNRGFEGFLSGLAATLNSPSWIHLWYMYTLIALYMLSPIMYGGLRSLNRSGHIYVFILALLPTIKTVLQILLPQSVAAYINIDIINKLTFFGGHLSTFVLGYYLANIKRKIPNWVLLVSTAVLLILIIYGTYTLTVRNGQYTQTFQNQSSGFEILLASCVFLLFKQNMDRKSKVLNYIPVIPLSLPIYLMHAILLSWMNGVYAVKSFWGTIIFTVLNFVVCYFATKTAATIRPLCYIVTGMSFKEACNSCNWIYSYRLWKNSVK